MAEGSRKEQASPDECPSCGGVLIQDYQRSEEVCSDCGLVVRERLKDRGPEWRSYDDEGEDRSRGGPPVTEEIHDRGLGTTLGSPTRDGKGKALPPGRRADFGRQRKWQHRFSVQGERGLKAGLNRAKTVRSLLGIPRGIGQRACRLYRLASNDNLVKGRSRDAFVAAAYDVACREASVPRSLDDFADCLGVDISQAKNAKKVLESEFSIVPPFPSLSKRVKELLDECYLPKDSIRSIRNEARQMVTEIRERSPPPGYTGRNPKGIAAALVYKVFLKAGCPESKERLANMVGVSRTTVKKAVDFLEEEVL